MDEAADQDQPFGDEARDGVTRDKRGGGLVCGCFDNKVYQRDANAFACELPEEEDVTASACSPRTSTTRDQPPPRVLFAFCPPLIHPRRGRKGYTA